MVLVFVNTINDGRNTSVRVLEQAVEGNDFPRGSVWEGVW